MYLFPSSTNECFLRNSSNRINGEVGMSRFFRRKKKEEKKEEKKPEEKKK